MFRRHCLATLLLCAICASGCASGKRISLTTEAAPTNLAIDPQAIQRVDYQVDAGIATRSSNDQPENELPESDNGDEASQTESRHGSAASETKLDDPSLEKANTETPERLFESDGQAAHQASGQTLLLDEVLISVSNCYPLLEIAVAELAEAEGKTLAAWGSFDTVLSGYAINKSLGFYENYRHGGKISRPLWSGSEVYGGYRVGRGVFEPWYQERQTNEGGEFKAGVKHPFLKGRAIDGRRAAVQSATLERQRLGPDIAARVIGMQRAASQAYWKWVASGLATQTQRRLLELAEQRNESLVRQVKEGDLPKITEVDNGRFMAKRQVKLIETRRKVQEAAIKLSLFMRDSNCDPWVATDDMLPGDFPAATPLAPDTVESEISHALAQRPELRELDFQRRQVEVELCYAQNQTLPKLDAFAEAGQDVGEPTSAKRDKSELEVEIGLIAEVPLQRRLACGKIKAARAKLAQIAAKRSFAEDKIRSQVLDVVSALNNAYERIEQARENLRLTEQSLRLGRLRFDEGDIDIIALNIYETSLAEAELLVIDAELSYFNALADYRAALAIGQ